MGFRDITCVEARASNIEKARFADDVFDIDVQIIASDVESFLDSNKRKYDIVVFRGIL
jgi:16S rRNA G527 N7-methylase RsmG